MLDVELPAQLELSDNVEGPERAIAEHGGALWPRGRWSREASAGQRLSPQLFPISAADSALGARWSTHSRGRWAGGQEEPKQWSWWRRAPAVLPLLSAGICWLLEPFFPHQAPCLAPARPAQLPSSAGPMPSWAPQGHSRCHLAPWHLQQHPRGSEEGHQLQGARDTTVLAAGPCIHRAQPGWGKLPWVHGAVP